MSKLGYFLGGVVAGAAALCVTAYLVSRSDESDDVEQWPEDDEETTQEVSHG